MDETLHTARLRMDSFRWHDLDEIVRLCSDRDVVASTGTLPFPYEREHAKKWLDGILCDDPNEEVFALRHEGRLIGCMGFLPSWSHHRGEVGYWIGKDFMGRGFATEALGALAHWAFEDCGLHRLTASTFVENVASARVLEKNGFEREGLLRRHFVRWEVPRDLVVWGRLRPD